MKLSTQYNRASMIASICVLIVAGLAYYIAISYISDNQLDDDLREEFDEVAVYVGTNQKLPKPFEYDEHQASFVPVGDRTMPLKFINAPFIDPKTKKVEAGRAAIGIVQLKGINYETTIVESKEATEYLVQIIGTITAALSIVLLLVLFFINRFVLSGLWKPFYKLLQQMKTFSVGKQTDTKDDILKIDEFNELQLAINLMSERVSKDYQSLKIFTENASHEIMTPLSVITSKLDNLVQDETLKAEQFDQLQDIYDASNKLSRLNQSLLLLVKIDNHLINEAEEINLKLLIEQKLDQFQEIIRAKDLIINDILQDRVISGNSYLIDILLNNLISNAIRHNIAGGQLRLILNAQQFSISNTGSSDALDDTLIFERFQKGRSSEGLGLGLTIARNICDNYGYKLCYRFDSPFHFFIIKFDN